MMLSDWAVMPSMQVKMKFYKKSQGLGIGWPTFLTIIIVLAVVVAMIYFSFQGKDVLIAKVNSFFS